MTNDYNCPMKFDLYITSTYVSYHETVYNSISDVDIFSYA